MDCQVESFTCKALIKHLQKKLLKLNENPKNSIRKRILSAQQKDIESQIEKLTRRPQTHVECELTCLGMVTEAPDSRSRHEIEAIIDLYESNPKQDFIDRIKILKCYLAARRLSKKYPSQVPNELKAEDPHGTSPNPVFGDSHDAFDLSDSKEKHVLTKLQTSRTESEDEKHYYPVENSSHEKRTCLEKDAEQSAADELIHRRDLSGGEPISSEEVQGQIGQNHSEPLPIQLQTFRYNQLDNSNDEEETFFENDVESESRVDQTFLLKDASFHQIIGDRIGLFEALKTVSSDTQVLDQINRIELKIKDRSLDIEALSQLLKSHRQILESQEDQTFSIKPASFYRIIQVAFAIFVILLLFFFCFLYFISLFLLDDGVNIVQFF